MEVQMPATKLQRTGSFLPFTSMRDVPEFDNRLTRLMREPLSFFAPELLAPTFSIWTPPVEISETEMEFTLKFEVPGMMKKDINIEYEKGILTVSGEKFEEKKEGDSRKYHLIERNFGSFERSFSFPEFVEADKISADFKDGILMIHLPKTEESRKPKGRKIEIGETI
jgi:HSP20 family protein